MAIGLDEADLSDGVGRFHFCRAGQRGLLCSLCRGHPDAVVIGAPGVAQAALVRIADRHSVRVRNHVSDGLRFVLPGGMTGFVQRLFMQVLGQNLVG